MLTINIYLYFTELTVDDVDSDYFETFSKVENGRVALKDLINYLQIIYIIPPKTLAGIVISYDTDNMGALDKQQYINLMIDMRPDEYEKINLTSFDKFDLKGDGYIDGFELFVVMNRMNIPILYKTANERIRRVSKNNNNKIDRQEFKNLFNGFKIKKKKLLL